MSTTGAHGSSDRRVGRRALLTRFFSVARDAVRETQAVAPESAGRPADSTTVSEPAQVVRLQPAACIAYRGTLCSVCFERCPEPGAIVREAGRPRVIADLCTGCGECVARCPAPINALVLMDR